MKKNRNVIGKIRALGHLLNNMKVLTTKLQTISYVVSYLNKTLSNESISFELLSEAPLWLRFLSKGQYCGYKNTIYVPKFHLELVKSEHDTDKTIATGKILPWLMLYHDTKTISILSTLRLLFITRYQIHYTLYEILFLKATKNKFYEVIALGFITSRKGIFGKLSYDTVEKYISNILETNKPD